MTMMTKPPVLGEPAASKRSVATNRSFNTPPEPTAQDGSHAVAALLQGPGVTSVKCPPALPESFLVEVRTWLSAANPADRSDLVSTLLAEVREQLQAIDPDL
jgi:hypothetical protein